MICRYLLLIFWLGVLGLPTLGDEATLTSRSSNRTKTIAGKVLDFDGKVLHLCVPTYCSLDDEACRAWNTSPRDLRTEMKKEYNETPPLVWITTAWKLDEWQIKVHFGETLLPKPPGPGITNQYDPSAHKRQANTMNDDGAHSTTTPPPCLDRKDDSVYLKRGTEGKSVGVIENIKDGKLTFRDTTAKKEIQIGLEDLNDIAFGNCK